MCCLKQRGSIKTFTPPTPKCQWCLLASSCKCFDYIWRSLPWCFFGILFPFLPHITLCQFKCSQRNIDISVGRNVNLVVCLCSGTSLPFHMDTLKARGVLSQPSASHIWKGEESHDKPEQASAADMAMINSDAAWNDEISWAAWIADEFDFSWPVWMNTIRDYPSTKKKKTLKKKKYSWFLSYECVKLHLSILYDVLVVKSYSVMLQASEIEG